MEDLTHSSIQRKSLQCHHVLLQGMMLTIVHPLLRIPWKNWVNLLNNLQVTSVCVFEWMHILRCHLLADLVYCICSKQIFINAPPVLFLVTLFSPKKYLLYIQTETRLQTSCDSCVGESQLFAGRAAMASPMILIIISDLH